MNKALSYLACLGMSWMVASGLCRMQGGEAATAPGAKTRVLVVTGGHDFEREQFFQMFKDNADITFTAAEHPKAHALLKPEAARQWDVLVLYDMWAEISEEAKGDFIARLKDGKGLVALHHCLGSYPKWDEYVKIIGGKYHLTKYVQDGVEKPGSTYLHDVEIPVRVADPAHPVVRGVKDFTIHDETYGGFEVRAESHPLLSTQTPTSGPTIAWTTTYAAARVVYLQLGHDHWAFENPN